MSPSTQPFLCSPSASRETGSHAKAVRAFVQSHPNIDTRKISCSGQARGCPGGPGGRQARAHLLTRSLSPGRTEAGGAGSLRTLCGLPGGQRQQNPSVAGTSSKPLGIVLNGEKNSRSPAGRTETTTVPLSVGRVTGCFPGRGKQHHRPCAEAPGGCALWPPKQLVQMACCLLDPLQFRGAQRRTRPLETLEHPNPVLGELQELCHPTPLHLLDSYAS